MKKLYTANRNRNDWKFQLHRNKLEWVKPISKMKRKNPIQFLQSEDIKTDHWVGHSLLK